MNVLVIGGAGYIGSHCVRQLVEAGHRPVVLDNLAYGHRAAVAPEIPFYRGSMGDAALVRAVLEREAIDLVMHFAAFIFVGESVHQPLRYYRNNVAEVVTLLETMVAAGVRKFVFSSTCATHGVPERLPMTEDLPQVPISPYGQTKLDVENLLKACARAYGLASASFRYFNASGAAADGTIGEDHDPETHLIPLVIQAAMGRRAHIEVFGEDYPTPDGTCLRDYIHVDDLSRAHIAVFDKLAEPGACLFYNLGTGIPTSVRELIRVVEEVTGLRVPVKLGPRREGDSPALYADASKAGRELGWRPRYLDIREIVETAWRWHRSHPDGFKTRLS